MTFIHIAAPTPAPLAAPGQLMPKAIANPQEDHPALRMALMSELKELLAYAQAGNSIDVQGSDGMTPLMWATARFNNDSESPTRDREAEELLTQISRRSDLSLTDIHHDNALIVAAKRRDALAFKALLADERADPHHYGMHGSAARIAIRMGNLDIVGALLRWRDPQAKDSHGHTLRQLAAKERNRQTTNFIDAFTRASLEQRALTEDTAPALDLAARRAQATPSPSASAPRPKQL